MNKDHGFPRYDVLSQKYNSEHVGDVLVSAALQEDRIQTITDITYDFDRPNRKLNINFTAKKADGTVITGGV